MGTVVPSWRGWQVCGLSFGQHSNDSCRDSELAFSLYSLQDTRQTYQLRLNSLGTRHNRYEGAAHLPVGAVSPVGPGNAGWAGCRVGPCLGTRVGSALVRNLKGAEEAERAHLQP